MPSREVYILAHFLIGWALFGLGLILAYRLELGCSKKKLIVPFLITLLGSIMLLGFRY